MHHWLPSHYMSADMQSHLPPMPPGAAPRRTGLVWHERYMWHHAGKYAINEWVQPVRHFENPETKRRLYNLLSVSGLTEKLFPIKPRLASIPEIARFHTEDYISKVQKMSEENGGDTGDFANIARGGYDIALLAAGGAMEAVRAVATGLVQNAYVLCRPPGHHAERDRGMGFCVFNNVALAGMHAREELGVKKIAIFDYDVHHGNGTQQAFYDTDQVLFISVHQDSNYPLDTGAVSEQGAGKGQYFNINVPLPPGSGSGAYKAVLKRIVEPAFQAFKPDLILISAGYDAAFLDPLGKMMLTSDDYRWIAQKLIGLAGSLCDGKIVFVHEGGYSDVYVPFCGLAVVEELCGVKTEVEDPLKTDGLNWGYQSLQQHQLEAIMRAEEVVRNMEKTLR